MAEESKTPEETPSPPEPNDDPDGPASSRGEVYLIAQGGGSKFFKIGRSKGAGRRISELQAGNPQWLSMKGREVVDNMVEVKRLLLAEMGKMRDKFVPMPVGNGWFEGDSDKALEIFESLVGNYIKSL